MIRDDFAGPGGWDEGLRRYLGLDNVIGVEWDAAACATRHAAGLRTVRADVAEMPSQPWVGKVSGYLGSPPCTMFSAAGHGAGRDAIDLFAAGFDAIAQGRDPREEVRRAAHAPIRAALARKNEAKKPDKRRTAAQLDAMATHAAYVAALVLEPARVIFDLRPRWVALEQVPAVLPLWQRLARHLDALGYATYAAKVNAADYGVPQTRVRAVLLASLDRQVGCPPRTHDANPQGADLFGAGLARWVSMAEALDWGYRGRPSPSVMTPHGGGTHNIFNGGANSRRTLEQAMGDPELWEGPPLAGVRVGFPRRDDLGTSPDGYRERDMRSIDQPAQVVVTEKARSWIVNTGSDWKKGGTRENAQTIDASTSPAPAVDGKGRWWVTRPATTIAGDPRVHPPGHKINQDDRDRLGATEAAERYEGRAGENAIRVQPHEAAILQSFPADYPWQGNRTKVFQQIGNAVPPLLAAHLVAEAAGLGAGA